MILEVRAFRRVIALKDPVFVVILFLTDLNSFGWMEAHRGSSMDSLKV
jgi:hypothetical protein